jgi:sugar lactone lactonase YvrE
VEAAPMCVDMTNDGSPDCMIGDQEYGAVVYYAEAGALPTPQPTLVPSMTQLPTPAQLTSPTISMGETITLAGSGSADLEDGIGISASFDDPAAVAVTTDSSILYVADRHNHAVRMVNLTTRAVSTLAGSGSSGSADGFGTSATLSYPGGIALSHNDTFLYICDSDNGRIRMINLATTQVSTVATSFTFPFGLGLSSDGATLYVADRGSHKIRMVDLATAAVSTLAGSDSSGSANGFGTSASFSYPNGDMASSSDGSYLYVADCDNSLVRMINLATTQVSTLAGSGDDAYADGTGASASFYHPRAVALSSDDAILYVADGANNRLRMIDLATTQVTTLAGSGDAAFADGTGANASFYYSMGLTLSSDGGTLFVADSKNERIRAVGTEPTPAPLPPSNKPTLKVTTPPTTSLPSNKPTPKPTTSPAPAPTAAKPGDDGPDDGTLQEIGDAVVDYWSATKTLLKDIWAAVF